MQESIGTKLRAAREARRAGDRAGALRLYQDASEEARSLGHTAGEIHALRHVSDLAREIGDASTALAAGTCAVTLCRGQTETTPLEFANALRVNALALELEGRPSEAHRLWQEARQLYTAAGVAAGVQECEIHL